MICLPATATYLKPCQVKDQVHNHDDHEVGARRASADGGLYAVVEDIDCDVFILITLMPILKKVVNANSVVLNSPALPLCEKK